MGKISLVRLDEFDSLEGCLYSVASDDCENTLFDNFINENIQIYPNEVGEIIGKLKVMSSKTGFTDIFFRIIEGRPGDGVCAITDYKKKLRLYCVRFGNILLVLGGGGPKTTRTYQEDQKLLAENLMMQNVSKQITEAIKNKELYIDDDGSLLGPMVIK